MHGRVAGRPPQLDPAAEKRLYALMLEAASDGILRSAHDLSEGGLAMALAECCFRGEEASFGGRFEVRPLGLPDDVLIFSESPSRMVVSTHDEGRLQALARRHGVSSVRLGAVGGERLTLLSDGRTLVDLPVSPAPRGLAGPGSGAGAVGWVNIAGAPGVAPPFMSRRASVDDDHFHDQCGLFGIFGHPEAARLAYLGLYALQHRGQESAGIVASDGQRLRLEKGMGLVNDVFTDAQLEALPGDRAIGHVRYSTAGDTVAVERPAHPDRLPPRADRARPQRQPRQRATCCATSWRRRARSSSPPPTPR